MTFDSTDGSDDLNQNHRRVIQSAFAHLDDLLSQVEANFGSSGKVFPRYVPDLSVTQQAIVRDYITQIRAQMRTALQVLSIEIPAASINASHSITTALTMAQVALEEIGPAYLRGYGAIAAPDTVELLMADLARSFRRMSVFLTGGAARNLEQRIHRLETRSSDLSVLPTLERIITRHGLIEFRGALQALLEQMESRIYEIAVFGRVSSGKSSLLNTILGTDILPVGVTPVTAVATRIVWGEDAQMHVVYGTGREQHMPATQIAEFVSERANPDNRKQVSRITVSVPCASLRPGIAFVDTPGVGSMASSGAREAYTYLPRCDLGILLVDASSTPTPEDIGIVRLLNDSGISPLAVISKADLLSATDLGEVREYLHNAIQTQVGIDIPVHPVSCVSGSGKQAQDWFVNELESRCAEGRALAEASVRRKLHALRQSVAATLQAILESSMGRHTTDVARDMPNLQLLALEAEGVLSRTKTACTELADLSVYARSMATRAAAQSLIRHGRKPVADAEKIEEILRQAIASAADYARSPMRQDLLDARDRLRSILSRMATAFPFIAIQPDEINVDLVTLPTIELPAEHLRIQFHWSAWRSWFPASLARDLTSQIETGIGDELESAFQRFRRELQHWSMRSISMLSEQFSAQAEPIRAHARRLIQFQQGAYDEEGIRNSLADLSQPATESSH